MESPAAPSDQKRFSVYKGTMSMSNGKDRFQEMHTALDGEIPPSSVQVTTPPSVPTTSPPQQHGDGAAAEITDPHLLRILSDLPTRTRQGASKPVPSPVTQGWTELKTGRTLDSKTTMGSVSYDDLYYYAKPASSLILAFVHEARGTWKILSDGAAARIFKTKRKRKRKEAIECENRIVEGGVMLPFWPDTLYAKELGVDTVLPPKRAPPKKGVSAAPPDKLYEATEIPEFERFPLDRLASPPSTSAPAEEDPPPSVIEKSASPPPPVIEKSASPPPPIVEESALPSPPPIVEESAPPSPPPIVEKSAPARKRSRPAAPKKKTTPAKKRRAPAPQGEEVHTVTEWTARMLLQWRQHSPELFRQAFQEPAARIDQEQGKLTEAAFRDVQRNDETSEDRRGAFFLAVQYVLEHRAEFHELKDLTLPPPPERKDIFSCAF